MRVIVACVALVAAACTGWAAPTSTAGVVPVTTTTSERSTTTTAATPGTTATDQDAISKGTICWASAPASGEATISFVDATAELGLVEPFVGMHAHAAAWGDFDGDGGADLVLGTFANRPIENYQVRGADGPSPDVLVRIGADGAFTFDDPGLPPVFGRTSGAVAADLDHDGDQDLVLIRNMRPRERSEAPSAIYRNDGVGWTEIELELGRFFSGRSAGVFDFDHDGLLDLFLVEDRFGGGDSSVLLHNLGGLEFEDATVAAGIPEGVHGLGLATSDLNADGYTDFFVGGSNRLFIGGPNGFTEADSAVFQWEVFGDEDDAAGAAIADLNRDGLPDLVLGHHYNSTLSRGAEVPVRVYLNRGADGAGMPTFEDVTDRTGLPGLQTKAPHIEIADFDNDGWPDILTTASAADGSKPAVFRHLGIDADGVPSFATPDGLGDAQYWVTGPTADIDRDGRLDVMLVEWEPTLPSLLMRNDTASGHWLEVSVDAASDRQPIGTVVSVWEAGGLGDPGSLIGVREIVASQGYGAGNLQVVHFGLGDLDLVDLEVAYPGGEVVELSATETNRHLRLPDGC